MNKGKIIYSDSAAGSSDQANTTGACTISSPVILSGMSHEVRTHMNAIVAFSYLLKRNNCNDLEREEFSTQILSSCEQLIGLLDNFLDSAIIDSGKMKVFMKECRLSSMLDELLTEFRETLNREAHQGVVLVSENVSGDSGKVKLDSDRVFRVIKILFRNALHNTKSGYIKIGYTYSDNTLTFHVLDSGQGYFKCKEFLHTEDLNESLTQFDDTVTAINITLANKLITTLGGTAWIECNGLTGSAIYFSVPVVEAAVSPDISINKYISSVKAI
jgi:K+-sensing histidine kinase KdpD